MRKNRKGTTMVEIIIALTVLLLIVGIFTQAATLAGNMLTKAEKTKEDSALLLKKYYLDELEPQQIFGGKGEKITFTRDNGDTNHQFSVELELFEYKDKTGLAGTIYDFGGKSRGDSAEGEMAP